MNLKYKSTKKQKIIMSLALISSFIVFVDSTIVNLALPHIESYFSPERSQLEWVINSYTLSFAAIMLGSGSLSDCLGPRKIFILGVSFFLFSSIACALSNSIFILNISRLIQGIGAALMLPSSLILATSTQDDETKRSHTIGYWAAAGGIGLAAGPFLGGILINFLGWESIFWVNVIICFSLLILGFNHLPKIAVKKRKLDISGQLSATTCIAGLIFLLIEGPVLGWFNYWIAISFIIMLASLITFIVVEKKTDSPILPNDIFLNKTFLISILQGALFNFMFYGLLFALSFNFQLHYKLSSILSGLAFLPFTGLVAVGNLTASKLAMRQSRIHVLYLGQLILITSLILILFFAKFHLPLWCTLLTLLFTGFSSGLLVPTMTAQTLSTVSKELHGAASAAFNTSRQIGGAIGVAIFGPLLGVTASLERGFVICLALASCSVFISLLCNHFYYNKKT